jgi:hypothetical protein
MSKAREYEEYAAECLRLAEREPLDRDLWVALAAKWTALPALAARSDEDPVVD